jgi:double-strand break repair protein MRE11
MAESGGELIVKILIASDIHVGYAEKDKIRYADSYNTLEEVLDTAVKQRVDMILLGIYILLLFDYKYSL